MTENVVEKAKNFAIKAHEDIQQKRKYTNDPYWHHSANVVDIIKKHTNSSDSVLAAAWLHDVVEDTPITIEDIINEFGEEIAALVAMVTDVSKPTDGNRKTRKEIDKKHIEKASAEGKTIKLADLLDNTQSIFEHDKKFAIVYFEEKKSLLEVLQEGDNTLYKIAHGVVKNYYYFQK